MVLENCRNKTSGFQYKTENLDANTFRFAKQPHNPNTFLHGDVVNVE